MFIRRKRAPSLTAVLVAGPTTAVVAGLVFGFHHAFWVGLGLTMGVSLVGSFLALLLSRWI